MRKVRHRWAENIKGQKCSSGFTIVEVVIAAGILSVVFLATMALINFQRLQSRKAMEQAIMLDFAEHYIEIARNKPFSQIVGGTPINPLYDGQHSAPDIRFPTNSGWQSLWTTDFRNFHPDLEWFEGSSPQYKCIITNQMVGSDTRSKHIELDVRWKPPLGRGADWLSIRLDTLVYQDFN